MADRSGITITRSGLPLGGPIYFATDPADSVVGAEIRATGWWQGVETRLICSLVGAGDHAVDAGAQVGYFTVVLSRRVGAAGLVLAFEPEPRNFELLKANCILNGASNASLRRQALGDRAGPVPLHLGSDNLGDHRLHAAPGRAMVPVDLVRLDDVLGGDRIDFLKLDTQGSEAAILKGAARTIRASAGRLVCLMELSPILSEAAGHGREGMLELLTELGAQAFTATIPLSPLAAADVAATWDRLRASGIEDANEMLLLAFSDEAAARIR